MAEQLRFEQRSGGLWVAELDGGSSYRIEMHPGKLRADYALTFVARRPDTWARRGWTLKYESVSVHRTLERAVERANRHQRDRAKPAE